MAKPLRKQLAKLERRRKNAPTGSGYKLPGSMNKRKS